LIAPLIFPAKRKPTINEKLFLNQQHKASRLAPRIFFYGFFVLFDRSIDPLAPILANGDHPHFESGLPRQAAAASYGHGCGSAPMSRDINCKL